ncbi:MAG: ATP-binding protein [Bacteroidota bacterium]|nr:ATP-binding protein [Bacteroidota bacterium]
MLRIEQIQNVIDAQELSFAHKDVKLSREFLIKVPVVKNFVTIITGLRRCGKSTLLLQVLKKDYKDALYLNFEDIRLTGFEPKDFVRLHQEIVRRKHKVLFFDEIQLVEKWEIFIHQLLNENYTVFVTGSNASLLSREMGTHLTGRHLSMELFPFSYTEFLAFKKAKPKKGTLMEYLQTGGMPEFVKTKQTLILTSLAEDIIVRDIAVRHSVRDVSALKQLAVYLISNVGKPVSANKLAGMFGIKSVTTILEYFSYYADVYLLEFLPQFNYSLKAQVRNPKKVYAIDTGFINAASLSFSEDFGHKLENLVYLHLRRKHKELYFFKDKGECDFVVFEKNEVQQLIQVCLEVNDENFEREKNGLIEALRFFKKKEGVIVTMNQSDEFNIEGCKIKLVPAYEFMS